MQVNNWSSVDLPALRELMAKEQKFLDWLGERSQDSFGWTLQVAQLFYRV